MESLNAACPLVLRAVHCPHCLDWHQWIVMQCHHNWIRKWAHFHAWVAPKPTAANLWKRHFGTNYFVSCREVVLVECTSTTTGQQTFGNINGVPCRELEAAPFLGCPFIGGSTVYQDTYCICSELHTGYWFTVVVKCGCAFLVLYACGGMYWASWPCFCRSKTRLLPQLLIICLGHPSLPPSSHRLPPPTASDLCPFPPLLRFLPELQKIMISKACSAQLVIHHAISTRKVLIGEPNFFFVPFQFNCTPILIWQTND